MTITPRNMFEQYLQTPVEFNSLEELVNLPFVKSMANRENFYRFSITTDKTKKLMAEYNEGGEWWVVGFLSETIAELPEWSPQKNDIESKSDITLQQSKATYTGMYMKDFK
jgi:hypothetical protein